MLNEQASDAIVRHQINLFRSANRLARESNERLTFSEPELRALIFETYGSIPDDQGRNAATDALVLALINLRGEVWDNLVTEWQEEMRALVRAEKQFLPAVYAGASPVDLELVAVATTGLATGTRFEGRTVTQHLRRQQAADSAVIRATIGNAVEQGFGARQAATALTGTRALSGRDAALQQTRNQVFTLARTSTTAVTSMTRQRFTEANSHVIKKEKFIAVLDGRTTPICRANSNKVFDKGEGAQPPLHHRCRSIRISLIDTEGLGSRATNPTTEKGLLREYRKEHNLKNIRSRKDLPRGHKGAYDQFRRRRIRELAGPVEPADLSYSDWLKRQPVQFQEDVLGVSKAKLFREGNLPLDRFIDDAGEELTLFDLSKRDAQAFRDAGLDPDSPQWRSYLRDAS